MKPHHLHLEAFGPYAEPNSIDFDSLSDEGLFLIHGSTGAGKTFLLDALCFALYGEVSGGRNLKALRSDHAAAGAVPRVQLEFSCSGGRYRVERSPAYSAPKSRGQGFTDKPPTAALFRLNGSAAEPISSRSSEVTREVQSLVGLTADQFRQVILLPQGQFAEVLRAKADDREALLKTLFDSTTFERASLWLEEQAKAARQALAEQSRELEGLRQQALALWEPFATPAAAPAAPAHSAADPADASELDSLVAQMSAVVTTAGAALAERQSALEGAQQAAAALDRLAERWQRRANASARLQELEGKRELVEQFRQKLQRAERAEALRPSLEATATAEAAFQELQQRCSGQLRLAARSQAEARALPQALRHLELTALPRPDALAEGRAVLAAWMAELKALARQAEQRLEAERSAAAATRLAAAAAARLSTAQAELTARLERRQSSTTAVQAATTARDQCDGLRRAAAEAERQWQAGEALRQAERQLQDSRSRREACEANLRRSTATVLALRQGQLAGMAARLAAGLEPGTACPVCGATDHPAPAQPAADAVSDAALQAAEQAETEAGAAARAAATALASAEAQCKGLLEQAGAAATDLEAARSAAHQAGEALRAAEALLHQLPALQAALAEHEQVLTSLQATVQAASTEQALQQQSAAAATARAAERQAEIEAALGADLDPHQVLQSLAPLEAALRDLAASSQAWTEASTRLEQARARLTADLRGSGFVDASAVQASLKEESWRLELRERIAAVEREQIELRGQLAAPDLADLPDQRPDTAAAAAAVQAADAARTAALDHHSQTRTAATALQRLVAAQRRLLSSQAAAQDHAQRLSSVADRCSGRSAPHISLQRWVLSAHLAEICRFANQRLDLMTSGRYQLRLSDEGGRGGRNAGLGLRVLDAYTGEEREVSSLSGGETFQASLALALGVADTVQAHAGGVQLEALFIDEGFGSLDPDNLQLAMDELDRLREGGRMIGVISHVGALRERIRAGIAISSGQNGSRATVCRTALS